MSIFANHHVESASMAGGSTPISSSLLPRRRSKRDQQQQAMMTPLRTPFPSSPLEQKRLQQASRALAARVSSGGASASAEGLWTSPLAGFSSPTATTTAPGEGAATGPGAATVAEEYENYSLHSSRSPPIVFGEEENRGLDILKAADFSNCSPSGSSSSPSATTATTSSSFQQTVTSAFQRSCSPYSWATPLSSSAAMDNHTTAQQQDMQNDRTEMWLSAAEDMSCKAEDGGAVNNMDGLTSSSSSYPLPVSPSSGGMATGALDYASVYDGAYHSPSTYLIPASGSEAYDSQRDMMSASDYDVPSAIAPRTTADGLPRQYPVHYPEHQLGMLPVADMTGNNNSSAAEAAADEPYAQLIFKAFMSVPSHAMTIQELYQWFRDNTSKAAKGQGQGWQNSIRHNLSMNDAFVKRERKLAPPQSPSKQQDESSSPSGTTSAKTAARTAQGDIIQNDDDDAVDVDATITSPAVDARTKTSSDNVVKSSKKKGSNKDNNNIPQPKPPSEWVLADFAIRQGYVISTTRYRKQAANKSRQQAAAAAAAMAASMSGGHHQHQHLPARVASGRKGGLSSHRSRTAARSRMMAMYQQQQQQQQPRSDAAAYQYVRGGPPPTGYPQMRAAYAGAGNSHQYALDGAYPPHPQTGMEMLGLEYGAYPPAPASASQQYHRLYDYVSPDAEQLIPPPPSSYTPPPPAFPGNGGAGSLMMARAPTVKSESLADEPLTPTDGAGSADMAPFLSQQSSSSCGGDSSMLLAQSFGPTPGFPYGLGDVVGVYEAGSPPPSGESMPLFASAEEMSQLLGSSGCQQFPRTAWSAEGTGEGTYPFQFPQSQE